jgi:uncharacterized LabA/DUF88 family protein
MSDTTPNETLVYVDGQNLKGSAVNVFGRKSMDADLSQLLHAIVATQPGAQMKAGRYYSGLPTKEDPLRRAEAIVMLDRFKAQGIRTFANDIARNPAGQFKEVGIDLKLAADMVSDFLLNPKAKTFMVVSNDRDYEPAFALMRDLARFTNRPIDLVNVVTGNARGCAGARIVPLPQTAFEACVPAAEASASATNFRDAALQRLDTDPIAALDASTHAGHSPAQVLTRTTPLTRGTGFYVDANSLGASARRVFERTHLDLDIPKFIVNAVAETGRRYRLARAYMSQHSTEHDLVGHTLVENLATELKGQAVEAQKFPYAYQQSKIGFDHSGPGRGVPVNAIVGNEKRNNTQILADVVKDILSGRVDDIVLVSDDKNLWPIAELAQQLGRFSKQVIEVRSLHLDATPIERTNGTQISHEKYLEFTGGKDRLQTAVDQARASVDNERKAIESDARRKFGADVTIFVDPPDIDGVLLTRTQNWLVFDQGTSLAFAPRGQFNPQPGLRYILEDGAIQQIAPALEDPSLQRTAERPLQAERAGRSA